MYFEPSFRNLIFQLHFLSKIIQETSNLNDFKFPFFVIILDPVLALRSQVAQLGLLGTFFLAKLLKEKSSFI